MGEKFVSYQSIGTLGLLVCTVRFKCFVSVSGVVPSTSGRPKSAVVGASTPSFPSTFNLVSSYAPRFFFQHRASVSFSGMMQCLLKTRAWVLCSTENASPVSLLLLKVITRLLQREIHSKAECHQKGQPPSRENQKRKREREREREKREFPSGSAGKMPALSSQPTRLKGHKKENILSLHA